MLSYVVKHRAATIAAVVLVGVASGSLLGGASAAGRRPQAVNRAPVYALAGKCFALRSLADGRFVAPRSASYAADARLRSAAAAFYLKAAGLGTYMLYDRRAKLVSVASGARTVTAASSAGPHAVFSARAVAGTKAEFTLRSTLDHRRLVVRKGVASLGLTRAANAAGRFVFVATGGCRAFPEARVNATVHGRPTVLKHGRIFGFIDDHVHITGNMRAGGDVISGQPYAVRHPDRARRGRQDPRPRRQARRHRQPAAHRAPVRDPRHARLAELQGLADVQLDGPPAGLLRVARARMARRPADGRRADRRRRPLCRIEPRRRPDVLGDRLDRGSDPHAERNAELHRRAERRPRAGLVPARLSARQARR